MKTISVVTPCFNEDQNVRLLYERVRNVFAGLEGYEYEHVFADNASEDNTVSVLKELASEDTKVKVIVNSRNFGPTRSVFHAILNASGDAVVILAADLQDPPEVIPQFIERWEQGNKVVFGIRKKRSESKVMILLRKLYYRTLTYISEDQLMNDAGDFVLFDKEVLDILKRIKDNNPYIRGLLASIGFRQAGVEYEMQPRHAGKTSTSFFRLFIYALNGLVNQSMYPLRMASLIGLIMSAISIAYALTQLVLKMIFWENAPPGIPTLTIGLFFLSGVQLFLIGLIGEFVGAIYRQMKGLPIVVEEERINFDTEEP